MTQPAFKVITNPNPPEQAIRRVTAEEKQLLDNYDRCPPAIQQAIAQIVQAARQR